jgi:hypothetical protein
MSRSAIALPGNRDRHGGRVPEPAGFGGVLVGPLPLHEVEQVGLLPAK